jgi:hypothetical protein
MPGTSNVFIALATTASKLGGRTAAGEREPAVAWPRVAALGVVWGMSAPALKTNAANPDKTDRRFRFLMIGGW